MSSTSGALRPRTRRPFLAAVALLLFGCTSILQGRTSGPTRYQPPSVTIAAVGDTNGYNIVGVSGGHKDPLQNVRDLLREQDIFLFNLEGVLLSKELPAGTCRKFPRQSSFYSSPWIADFLRPTQFAIATLANNHILDCGHHGVQETIQQLSRRGILTVGADENSERACKPVRLQVHGVSLAVVAYLAMEPDWFSAGPDQAGAASWEGCAGEPTISEAGGRRGYRSRGAPSSPRADLDRPAAAVAHRFGAARPSRWG